MEPPEALQPGQILESWVANTYDHSPCLPEALVLCLSVTFPTSTFCFPLFSRGDWCLRRASLEDTSVKDRS